MLNDLILKVSGIYSELQVRHPGTIQAIPVKDTKTGLKIPYPQGLWILSWDSLPRLDVILLVDELDLNVELETTDESELAQQDRMWDVSRMMLGVIARPRNIRRRQPSPPPM